LAPSHRFLPWPRLPALAARGAAFAFAWFSCRLATAQPALPALREQPWWQAAPYVPLLLIVIGLLAGVIALLHGRLRRQRQDLASARDLLARQMTMLDAIPMPVYWRDRDLRLQAGNSHYAEACGQPRATLLHASVQESLRSLGTDTGAELLLRDYRHVMATGAPVIRERVTYLKARRATLQHWIAPMRDASNNIVGIVGGWLDITGRMQAAAELAEARDRAEAANQAKSTFLASIGHDIRTPMNAIMGMLELALQHGRLADPQRGQLQSALQAASSLLALIDDLLDLSRIEAGKFQLNPHPASLRDIVQEVAGVFSPLALGNGVALHTRITPEVAGRHRIDPVRFKQVLNNLVSNAVRFTTRGHIRIELQAAPPESGCQWVELSVADTGQGIAPDALPTVLDPFVQGHRQPGTPGTGLGLSICKRLVGKMGGTIGIDSHPGHGTRVTARLPLPVVDAARRGVAADAPARRRPVGGAPILLVDDHAANRLLLRHQLERLGHAVVCAEDGVQAFAAADHHVFKLAICDFAMPHMDGIEFVRRLRARPDANASIPVLGYTAGTQPADSRRALQAGMAAVLLKPVGLAELEAALDAHLPLVADTAPHGHVRNQAANAASASDTRRVAGT